MCADDAAKVPVLRDKPNRRRVNHGGLPTIEATGVYRHHGRKLPRLLPAFLVVIYDAVHDPRNFATENFATRLRP